MFGDLIARNFEPPRGRSFNNPKMVREKDYGIDPGR